MTKLRLGLALTAVALATAAMPAHAGSRYDGRWSVLVRSTGKACRPSAAYALAIRNGVVRYDGFAPLTVRGRVDPRGRVRVILHGGRQWAQAVGRLAGNRGAGTWRGRAPDRVCRGHWWARRK